MASELSPPQTFELLNARTFTMTQLTAGLNQVSPSTILNYTNKNGLDLCSETPGRGSAREFCLMDAYMLALVREIAGLTGDAQSAVNQVNALAFGRGAISRRTRARKKREFRIDPHAAHEMFWHRRALLTHVGHHEGDWFLIASDLRLGFSRLRYMPRGAPIYRRNQFSDLLHDGEIARVRGAFFNVTFALWTVDRHLLEAAK
jgi:hypothetical protein